MLSHVLEARKWLSKPWKSEDLWASQLRGWKADSEELEEVWANLMELKNSLQAG